MTIQERQEILFQFIGYGNPESPIWFMGIEERSPFKLDDSFLKKYLHVTYTNGNLQIESDNKSDYYIEPQGNKTYGGYKKILKEINSFSNYYENGRYFILNLWPWGKELTQQDFTQEEKNYWGFDNMSLNEIKISHKDIRFIYLKHFFRTFNWGEKFIFFCFGKSDRKYTNSFLCSLYGEEEPDILKNELCKNVFCECNKRFILPHASRNLITDEIINTLNKIIVNL